MASIIFFIICIFMVMIYEGLGIYFWKSKNPANFWAGEKIPPKAVSDIKKYNHANAIMWIIYGVLYLIPAFIGLTNVALAGVVMAVMVFGGLPILIFLYVKIIRPKYVSNSDKLYE